MKQLLMILGMILFHLIADYNLQGWLASAKQKEWWKENCSDEMYNKDYLCALIEHSLYWSIFIHIPVAIYLYQMLSERIFGTMWQLFLTTTLLNSVIHAIVDNEKANKHSINLCEDQFAHMAQVLVTGGMYILVSYLLNLT